MNPKILVSGATGTVGRATLRSLPAVGAAPVALVRDPVRAVEQLGSQTQTRTGDLSDESSLTDAFTGVDRLLLCSGNDPTMLEGQLTAARAIAGSSIERVV